MRDAQDVFIWSLGDTERYLFNDDDTADRYGFKSRVQSERLHSKNPTNSDKPLWKYIWIMKMPEQSCFSRDKICVENSCFYEM